MNKIILNASYDENVRSTVLTALQEIDRAELLRERAELELKIVNLESYLASNASELNSLLNLNSYLTPRGVIG